MKMRTVAAIVAVLALAGGGLANFARLRSLSAIGRAAGEPPSDAPAIPATIATVGARDFDVILSGLGVAQGLNTVTVRSRVDGEITQILFKEGQIVRAGDRLAQIDPKPYQAALDQAKAKLAQDMAQLQNAKADLQRYTTLAKKDFATGQQVDTQTATVAGDTALLEADRAAIDSAQTELDYTNITAPIGGRIGFRLVDQGNIVNAATQSGIASIAQVQPISVVFTLPEKDLDRVTQAMSRGTVEAVADTTDGSRELARGTLAVVNNQVDVNTGTVQIKATFANENLALWPGLSVSVRVRVDTLSNVVVIPWSAVQHSPQGAWTYVVDADKRARIRPIKTGDSNDDDVVVASGLTAGERVVTGGQYRLSEGARVAAPAPKAPDGDGGKT